MPDLMLYSGNTDRLLLVESVTSHGAVDAKRHNELAALFKEAKSGLCLCHRIRWFGAKTPC